MQIGARCAGLHQVPLARARRQAARAFFVVVVREAQSLFRIAMSNQKMILSV
jgi:hypothetical protein